MKSVFVLLVLAFISHAATASSETNPAYYPVIAIDTLDTTSVDTMVGVDTLSIRTDFIPERKWDYHIQFRGPVTGSGSDSMKHYIEIIAENSIGSLMGELVVDSLNASAGRSVWLPFNEEVFGERFDLRIRSATGAGGENIIPRWYIIRAKNQKR